MRTSPGFSILRFSTLCVIGFSMSIPFVWMVSTSFKPRKEVEEIAIVPDNPTISNYPVVLGLRPLPNQGSELKLRFGRWYFNSLFTTIGVTALQVLTSAMAAYAFARIRWRWRDRVFLMYLATMMIPGVVLMVPNYQLMVALKFTNTYHGLIIPAAFSAFGTFLLRQFMLSIPTSLDEAASIDGASHWTIFWEVTMPLSRAGLITVAITSSLGFYQSLIWPLILLSDEQRFPLPVGLMALDFNYSRQTELVMAGAVLAIVPLIVIFVSFQKYLVKGIMLGGLKG